MTNITFSLGSLHGVFSERTTSYVAYALNDPAPAERFSAGDVATALRTVDMWNFVEALDWVGGGVRRPVMLMLGPALGRVFARGELLRSCKETQRFRSCQEPFATWLAGSDNIELLEIADAAARLSESFAISGCVVNTRAALALSFAAEAAAGRRGSARWVAEAAATCVAGLDEDAYRTEVRQQVYDVCSVSPLIALK